MPSLDTLYFGNSTARWLVAGAIFVVTLAALSIARAVVLRYVKPTTTPRAFTLVAVEHTRYLFLAVLALTVAVTPLQLPTRGPVVLRIAVALVILLQFTWWAHGIVNFWMRRATRRRLQTDVGSVTTIRALGIAVKAIVWIICALAVLATFGIDVTALVAGLGIGGIAIALAVQSIVGDLFASVSIILDKPFLVGDFIKVGAQLGTVEEIGIKTTRIRSLSGEQLIFGNSDLLASRIQNFRRMTERRVVFSVGVEYGTPLAAIRRIPGLLHTAINSQELTRVDRVHFKEYGDSSLNFEAVYYVLRPDFNTYMDTQQAINVEIYRRFEDEEIAFAFPTRTVMLRVEPDQIGALMRARRSAEAAETPVEAATTREAA